MLSGGTFEIHPDGAKPFIAQEKAGDTSWGGYVGKHYVKNPGKSAVRVLLVEDKFAGKAASASTQAARTSGDESMKYGTGNPVDWLANQDAVVSATKNHRIILENEFVRVLDVTVAPGEVEKVHHHRWSSVLYFTEGGDFIDRDASGNVLFDTRTLDKPLPLPLATWKSRKRRTPWRISARLFRYGWCDSNSRETRNDTANGRVLAQARRHSTSLGRPRRSARCF